MPLTLYLDKNTRVFSALAPSNPATEMVPMLLARQSGAETVFPWCFAIGEDAAAELSIEKIVVTCDARRCSDMEAIAIIVRGRGRESLLAVNFTGKEIQFAGHALRGRACSAVREKETWRTVLGE